jgi:hypothetical protein
MISGRNALSASRVAVTNIVVFAVASADLTATGGDAHLIWAAARFMP